MSVSECFECEIVDAGIYVFNVYHTLLGCFEISAHFTMECGRLGFAGDTFTVTYLDALRSDRPYLPSFALEEKKHVVQRKNTH